MKTRYLKLIHIKLLEIKDSNIYCLEKEEKKSDNECSESDYMCDLKFERPKIIRSRFLNCFSVGGRGGRHICVVMVADRRSKPNLNCLFIRSTGGPGSWTPMTSTPASGAKRNPSPIPPGSTPSSHSLCPTTHAHQLLSTPFLPLLCHTIRALFLPSTPLLLLLMAPLLFHALLLPTMTLLAP